jgi:membrane fusion protein (multidrug efflux system)
MLGGIALVVVGAGIMWLRGGRYVSSDDAYVRAAKLMVSTDVSGIVSSVNVKQGQHVEAGDVLFRLDPAPFQTALDAAKAQLDEARLTLQAARQDYARIGLDIAAQQAVVEQAQASYDRMATLIRSHATSQAAFDEARFTLQTDQKKLDSLRQQQKVALTRLGGDVDRPIEDLPQYREAQAKVAEAQRQLDHSVVRAPFAGVVTEVAALQPGTYLVSQTAALTNTGAVGLVSTDKVWVEANLKETDLTYTKPGDPVEVSVDAYPGRVWQGKLESIYPATGSEFSILPAQNASGNWVKVVQRIPVRVSLERKPADPVLRAGMSVTVDIDTGHTRQLADLWGGHAGTAHAASP